MMEKLKFPWNWQPNHSEYPHTTIGGKNKHVSTENKRLKKKKKHKPKIKNKRGRGEIGRRATVRTLCRKTLQVQILSSALLSE